MAKEFRIAFAADGAEGVADKTKRLAGGMNDISESAKRAGRASEMLSRFIGPAAIGYGLLHAAQQTREYATRIQELSARLGVGTDTLQAWDYAARRTGWSIDEVRGAFQRLLISIAAAQTDKGKIEAFRQLGVSVSDLKRLGPEQIFARIAAELGKVGLSARDVRAMIQVLGSGSTALLASFRAGFSGSAAEAARLGMVIDKELIAKMDQAGKQSEALALRFRSALAPGIVWLQERLRDVMDLGQIVAGAPAAALGALSAGASLSEANAAARSVLHKVLDERIVDDTRKPPAASPIAIPDSLAAQAQAASGALARGGGRGSSDAMARQGLFVGAPPVNLMVAQRQLVYAAKADEKLARVNQQLASIEHALRDSGVATSGF